MWSSAGPCSVFDASMDGHENVSGDGEGWREAMPLSPPFERDSGLRQEAPAAKRLLPEALYGAVAPGQFGGDFPVGFSEGMLGVQPGGLFQVLDCLAVLAQPGAGHPPLVV